MRHIITVLIGTIFASYLQSVVRADILVGADGRMTAGKILSSNEKETVIQPDGGDAQAIRHVDHAAVARVIYTDQQGAVVPSASSAGPVAAKSQAAPGWEVPVEPTAPPVPSVHPYGATYYVIPLHGEVGATVLASALEKSLADAVLRKPTVIILDIQSPGGLVSEALQIMKVIGHYNKQARIIALTDQDLSAAAIFSLSVKTIYVKPSSTIGAATAFIPSQPQLSAKVEEKMQSAWRAAARNSAEEGGHEPLLAEAMIDNDLELHLEMVGTRPVVKEGPGEKTLCRKGRILTLTSHEAVECGLAAGEAEDIAALGKLLGYSNWAECKGLGTALAAYLPNRNAAFESQMKKVIADFVLNIKQAQADDPSQENTFVQTFTRPTHAPPTPGPGMHRPITHARTQTEQRIVHVSVNRREWKQKSLSCVVALQKCEENLHDALSLCQVFGLQSQGEPINDVLTQVSAVRAKIFDDRNKYGEGGSSVAAAPGPAAAPQPPSVQPGRPPVGPVSDPKSNPGVKAPSSAEATLKLKKIETSWQAAKAPVDVLATIKGRLGLKNDDGSLLIPRRARMSTAEAFRPPVTFRIVALTDNKDTRISYGAGQIIFNWEMNHDELRIDGGPPNGQRKAGVGRLPANQWVGIELMVRADEMVIYVDGAEQFRCKADFSKVNEPLSLTAHTGDLWVKSITVAQPAP